MKEDMLDIKQILLIRKVYNKFINERTKNDNLTSSYAVFVEALSNQTFHSQQELTDFIGCNKAHTSRTLLKMQLKGLIKPICAKGNEITLTDKGKDFAQKVNQNKKELMSELLENISEKEAEIFMKVTQQIIKNAKVIEEV